MRPSSRVAYEYMKESVACVRVIPTNQALKERLDAVKQAYLQNDKLSRPQCGDKNRKQGEADHKADQGCQIARSEDEESIPSAHCRCESLSVQILTQRVWSTLQRERMVA